MALFLVLSLLSAAADQGGPGGGARSGLEASFRASAVKGLERQERLQDNLAAEGTYERNQYVRNQKSKILKYELEHHVKGGRALEVVVKYDQVQPPGWIKTYAGGRATCFTDGYAFRLYRASPGRPWLIESYDDTDETLKHGKQLTTIKVTNFVRAATSLRDRPLRKVIESPGFKVGSVREVERDKSPLVEVKFTCSDPTYYCDSGRLVVDSSLDWTVKEFEVEHDMGQGRVEIDHGAVDSRRWGGDLVFPSRVFYRYSTRKKGGGAGSETILYTEEVVYNSVVTGSVTDDTFKLSHFQLPDISPRSSPRNSVFSFRNWPFWALNACVVVCLLLLSAFKKRRAGANPGNV